MLEQLPLRFNVAVPAPSPQPICKPGLQPLAVGCSLLYMHYEASILLRFYFRNIEIPPVDNFRREAEFKNPLVRHPAEAAVNRIIEPFQQALSLQLDAGCNFCGCGFPPKDESSEGFDATS